MARNDAEACMYIVGVESTSYFAAYQISVTTANGILALQPGVSVTIFLHSLIDMCRLTCVAGMFQCYCIPIWNPPLGCLNMNMHLCHLLGFDR